jgi:hypothetical protein
MTSWKQIDAILKKLMLLINVQGYCIFIAEIVFIDLIFDINDF